jgi:regulator of protease activity HflC (stomatin/prohibitin superfamily)
MEALIYLVALVAVLAALLLSRMFKRVTVMEYERGLRYQHGRFVGILEPGRHWIHTSSTRFVRVDVRPQYISVAGQEILTADGVSLRISLVATFEIEDPAVAVNSVADFHGALYLEIQLAAREVIGAGQIDELLADRAGFSARILELARPKVAALGLSLGAVDLKDLMFPGPLKKLFASVVQARKEGEAALEKARGETAALRNLANAARMVRENPALVQLRLLQQVSESTGNTFVIGLPTSSTPIPIDRPDAGELELPSADAGDET